jgi:hypothetical protein
VCVRIHLRHQGGCVTPAGSTGMQMPTADESCMLSHHVLQHMEARGVARA